MVTRHLGGRLAGEPQRGTLAQADQQHPARRLRNLAGASRHAARPRRPRASSLRYRSAGSTSWLDTQTITSYTRRMSTSAKLTTQIGRPYEFWRDAGPGRHTIRLRDSPQ